HGRHDSRMRPGPHDRRRLGGGLCAEKGAQPGHQERPGGAGQGEGHGLHTPRTCAGVRTLRRLTGGGSRPKAEGREIGDIVARPRMASVNPLSRELVFKLVYYGPGLGGKTTTLEHIHATAKPEHRGKLVSLATPVDRTLYFDFLPVRLPPIRGMHIRL